MIDKVSGLFKYIRYNVVLHKNRELINIDTKEKIITEWFNDDQAEHIKLGAIVKLLRIPTGSNCHQPTLATGLDIFLHRKKHERLDKTK